MVPMAKKAFLKHSTPDENPYHTIRPLDEGDPTTVIESTLFEN